MVHEDECAREILDVVPAVMRFIRTEMRRHRALGLSVPQFRTLVFIERAGGASLGSVAEHLGLTPPSACRIVDGLEGRTLVTRRQSAEDRRRVTLEITPGGKRALADARRETQKSLSGILAGVDQGELAAVMQSMLVLRNAFSARPGAPGALVGAGRSS
ncbi:MAG: MarR family winged helix-turn-helix transcriptional regulator [Spirochaetia bacterium]|jgi:DNA-binding MarR family transcriptional regulator